MNIFAIGNCSNNSSMVKYYRQLLVFGGYYFKGYHEIDSIADGNMPELCYKITFNTKGEIQRIETQSKGKTEDLIFSMPAVILFDYQKNKILLTFTDKNNNAVTYSGVHKCIIEIDGIFKKAYFTNATNEKISDNEGRYEIHYQFNENKILEWANVDENKKLKNTSLEFAKCNYTYGNNYIEEAYYNEGNHLAVLRGINWRGVECGSPSPNQYYNYSKVQYYLTREEDYKKVYFNENNHQVHISY